MANLLVFVAPLALIFPLSGAGGDAAELEDSASPVGTSSARLDPKQAELMAKSGQSLAPQSFVVPTQQQVRIERRVIFRVMPRSSTSRTSLVPNRQPSAQRTKIIERKIGKCIPLEKISALRTGSGKNLILFTRDSKVLSLRLEKSCRARDFYSGFYVEKDEDGQLCIDRDKLRSRSGAQCEVKRMRQLIAITK